MIGRSVWFVAGAAAGVYGTVRARRAAETFTAEGMRHRLKAVGVGARLLREEVAHGQAQAEVELRERHELATENQRALQASDGGLDTSSLVPREDGSTSNDS